MQAPLLLHFAGSPFPVRFAFAFNHVKKNKTLTIASFLLLVGTPGTQEDGLSMHTTMNKSIQKRLDHMKHQFDDLSATLQTNEAVRTRLLVA
jgi:hypothetical protein